MRPEKQIVKSDLSHCGIGPTEFEFWLAESLTDLDQIENIWLKRGAECWPEGTKIERVNFIDRPNIKWCLTTPSIPS